MAPEATQTDPDTELALGPMRLSTPLLGASGCVGYGKEYHDLWENSTDYDPEASISNLGALVTKAVSPEPRGGNYPDRLAETPAGLINSIGLQNPGVDAFIEEKLPELEDYGVPVIPNLVGDTHSDFAGLAERFAPLDAIPAVELDLSCPNVEKGGTSFADDLESLERSITLVCETTDDFLIAKLSPNVGDITEFAACAERAGADALTVANTWVAMSIDVDDRTSRISRMTGGLSGPAVRPLTLALVHKCYQTVEIPILASGGAVRTRDALEYLIAGARAVQLGTGLWIDPLAPLNITRGLRDYLDEHEMTLDQLIGSFNSPE